MRQKKVLSAISLSLLLAPMIVPGVWALTTAVNPEPPTKHIIENVPFMPEIKGGCTISCLRMQLAYYGTVYSQTYLMNLSGWDYAFTYVYPYEWGFVSVEPVQTVLYMGEMLGCEIEHYKNQTLEESWRTLKEFIAQDKPVLIPWQTHSVLAVGYDDEDNLVYIHDPAGGPDGAYLEHENFGAYVAMSLDTFKDSDHWGTSPMRNQYEMLVVKPPAVEPSMLWQEVLERNAGLLTDGAIDMRHFAEDLETGFGLTGEDLGVRLLQVKTMPFDCGWVRREDAAAFIGGLAQATGSKDLEEASIYLRSAAECFAEGKALLENKLRVGEIPDLPRVAEALRRAADYQERAGESLMKGAKDLSRPETQWKYALVAATIIAFLIVAFAVAFLRRAR